MRRSSRHSQRSIVAVALALAALQAFAATSREAGDASHGANWRVVGHLVESGGTAANANASIEGSVGQVLVQRSASASWAVQSGFWSAEPSGPLSDPVFSDQFEG